MTNYKRSRTNFILAAYTFLNSMLCIAQNPFGPHVQFSQLSQVLDEAKVAAVYRTTYENDRVVDSAAYYFRSLYELDSSFQWSTDETIIMKLKYNESGQFISLTQIESRTGSIDTIIKTMEYADFDDTEILKKVTVQDQNGKDISVVDYDIQANGSVFLEHNIKEGYYKTAYVYFVDDSILRSDTYLSVGDDTLSFNLIKSEYSIHDEIFQILEHGNYELSESILSERKGIPLMKVAEPLESTNMYLDSLSIQDSEGRFIQIVNKSEIVHYIYDSNGALVGCKIAKTDTPMLAAQKQAYKENVHINNVLAKGLTLVLSRNELGLPYNMSYIIGGAITGDRIKFRYDYRVE